MLHRLLVSLQTAPTKRDWSEMAIGALAFMGLALIPGQALFEPQVMPLAAWPTMALTALMAPAFLEEGVFRGAMVPARSEAKGGVLAIVLSTVLFMGRHVLEAMTFLPGARTVFLRPDFLFLAGRRARFDLRGAALAAWQSVDGRDASLDGGRRLEGALGRASAGRPDILTVSPVFSIETKRGTQPP